jgi:hypothetical protein
VCARRPRSWRSLGKNRDRDDDVARGDRF